MNPAPIGGPGDNTRLTVPIVTGGIPDATVGETTSRIPVFDAAAVLWLLVRNRCVPWKRSRPALPK